MLLIGLSAVGLVPCCLFYFGGFEMQLLEERILKDGKVFPGNVLKVDSFLNHQVDVELINEIGKEFYRLFKDCGVNKIFTIEASGIGIASLRSIFMFLLSLPRKHWARISLPMFIRRRSNPLPTARRMTLSSRRNSLIRMIEFSSSTISSHRAVLSTDLSS